MLNITWPSGLWLQGTSPLQDRWQTTGLTSIQFARDFFFFFYIYRVILTILAASQMAERYLCLTAVSRLWASRLRSSGTGWLWTWALLCMLHHTHTHTSSYWMTTACCCPTGPKWWVQGQRQRERPQETLLHLSLHCCCRNQDRVHTYCRCRIQIRTDYDKR